MNHWFSGKLRLKNIPLPSTRMHEHVHTPAQTQKIKKHDKGLNFWKGLPFSLGRPARQVGLKIPSKLKLTQHKRPVIIMAESTGESVCSEASNWPPPVALGLVCFPDHCPPACNGLRFPAAPMWWTVVAEGEWRQRIQAAVLNDPKQAARQPCDGRKLTGKCSNGSRQTIKWAVIWMFSLNKKEEMEGVSDWGLP